MSCSQASVDRVIQHPWVDAIETHHASQCAIMSLCVKRSGEAALYEMAMKALSSPQKSDFYLHNISVNHILPRQEPVLYFLQRQDGAEVKLAEICLK